MKDYMNYIVFVLTVYRVILKKARPNRKALSNGRFARLLIMHGRFAGHLFVTGRAELTKTLFPIACTGLPVLFRMAHPLRYGSMKSVRFTVTCSAKLFRPSTGILANHPPKAACNMRHGPVFDTDKSADSSSCEARARGNRFVQAFSMPLITCGIIR